MKNDEAKFILAAYRPDGRDAADPTFAEAIAQAGRDPHLQAWWERQRQTDAAIAAKLREIAPPAGLREAILAGGHASRPQRPRWAFPAWLAAAAAVVLSALALQRSSPSSRSDMAELSALAARDLARAHDDHVGFPANLAGVQARLANAPLPLTRELDLDLDDLRRRGCRTVRLGGREVFELCFQRDGTWFHLYAARRSDFATDATRDPARKLALHDNYGVTAWSDAKNVYALVARRAEAVRRVM